VVRLSFDVEMWRRGISTVPLPPDVRDEIEAGLRARLLLEIVAAGSDVVLDFAFWSRRLRDDYRKLLEPAGVVPEFAAAHRALAETLQGVQSVRFAAFGELDRHGQPAVGQDVVSALHQRAELRVHDTRARAAFHQLLNRDVALFSSQQAATLCHDDLHHGNVLFRMSPDGWRLVALLDWDKAWAGPAESDVARLAFWDDMTGPGFWEVYPALSETDDNAAQRALIYQLLWCLEYDDGSARHAADTTRLRRLLAVP
jgi:aminoglycoside phosphotransferase (APT) family kinase protein